MKIRPLALAALCAAALALPAQAQFEQFRGKMKPGLYEHRMEMDMGAMMPPPMNKQTRTMQHCYTEQDIEKGVMGKDSKMPENCSVKDFRMSGNTASYRMECTGNNAMTMDNKITFRDSGYASESTMTMDQGGQKMTMKQKSEGRYLGACK